MIWIIYGVVVLVLSGLIGLHLGRFHAAYTEMTGMMAGMTMGMLNGFLLGYAAAGLFGNMFWGNLFGILLGTALGCFFGRAGGLMGIMDGGMGGVMGGSMGAMLMVMLVWPAFMYWTAALLALVYLLGMAGLILIIEQSAPQYAVLHRLLPLFSRAANIRAASQTRRAPIDDYYTFLGVGQDANSEQITTAYLNQLSIADEETVARAERAYSILTDPNRRRVYDTRLAASQAAGDCCPPAPAPAPTQRVRTSATVVAPVATKQPASKPVSRPASRPKRPVKKEPPISWVGGTAAFGIAALLIGWWLFTQGSAGSSAPVTNAFTDNGVALPAEFVQKLEAKAVNVPLATDGKQAINLVVNGDSMSYKPDVIRVKQGTPVHFNLSTEGRDPGCGRFVGLRGLGVHAIANPGEITTLDFTPAQSGIFQINCNMQMMNPGYLIVTE